MIRNVFINRNFFFLWLGKIISQLGDKFYSIALAWWILQQTDSPGIMGFFLLVSVLPGLIFGFFAGAMVDRLNRKNILIVADIIRGKLVLIVAILSAFGLLQVWHVFVVSVAMSLTTAFFEPAVQAIIPQVVNKEELKKANSMNQMVNGLCNVAGPVMGATAISLFGATYVFLFNALSFIFSGIFEKLVVLKTKNYLPEKPNIWEDMKSGVLFLKEKIQVARVIIVIAVVHFFLGSLMVLLPFLAVSLNGKGVQNLGYLETMLGFGMLSGSIYIGRKKSNIRELYLLRMLMFIGGCFLMISLGKYFSINTVFIYMAILLFIGIGIAFASVYWQSLIQYNTPEHMTGRVFSVASLAVILPFLWHLGYLVYY